MKRSTKRAGYNLKETLKYISSMCSPAMTPGERKQALDWFAHSILKASLLDMVLSGEVEIIGVKNGEPVVRASTLPV